MTLSKTFWKIVLLLQAAIFLLAGGGYGQTLETVKDQVQEKTLSNGMKFIVLERHDAPVVSFHVYADVGSVNETYGITGISHLLEHMAFKGTKTVGTRDPEREARALQKMDRIYDQLIMEQYAVRPDSAKIRELQAAFAEARKEARALVVNNEFVDMVQEQGGQGLNASTNFDATQYYLSLPSNRLEFWMAMESDRFLNPVFREFFSERDVVMEERRLRIETQPFGKLFEDFMAVAFKAHPYHHTVVGHMSDLQRITREDVEQYFREYYSPANLTAAVVGDVKAAAVFELAETYFGRIPGGSKPEPLRTKEPPQSGERHVTVEVMSQPVVVVGYHRPDINSPEDLALDALANILGLGRSSRIYNRLVKEQKIAVQVGAFNGWPGNKYPNLFAMYAIPARGHTVQECLAALESEVERVRTEPVAAEELTKYKRHVRRWMINRLKSNGSMAYTLTFNDVIRGDWRKAFNIIDSVESVTAADVQAAAQKYLVRQNRTVGEIIPQQSAPVVF